MKETGFISGKVITLDEEIAEIENLVESNSVYRMVSIVVENLKSFRVVHIATLGTPLGEVSEILHVALNTVNKTIGK